MKELVEVIAKSLVEFPEEVVVTEKQSGKTTACGLCFALGLVLVYLVKVDLGAILFCLFSLVYSFLAGSIGEKIKYTFNHATTMAAPHFRCAWAICQTRSQFFSRMDFLLNVFGSLSSCRRKPRRIRRKSGIKFLFGSWR